MNWSMAAVVSFAFCKRLFRELFANVSLRWSSRRSADADAQGLGAVQRSIGFPAALCWWYRNALRSRCRQGIPTAMGVITADALPSNPLDALRELAVGEAELDRLRRATMTVARARGATWEQIGEALGVTRQSAWEYFSRETRSALARHVAKNDELTEVEAMAAAVAEVRDLLLTRPRTRRLHRQW
jgi:hypothetical protein